MITVYLDKDHIYADHADATIVDYSDYAKAYRQIMSCIHGSKDMVVVTYSRQIYKTLSVLQEFYMGSFTLREFTVKGYFVDKYGVLLPAYITDEDLMQDKIYTELDFSTGEGFENTILRHYYDGYFVSVAFPFGMLGALCRDFNVDDLKRTQNVLLRKIFKKRMEEFMQKAHSNYEKMVIEEFLNDFVSLKRNVTVYLFVKGYPVDFQERFLERSTIKCFENLRVTASYIMNAADLESLYKNEFQSYTDKMDICSIEECVSFMTGRFGFEHDYIMNRAMSDEELSKQTIQMIRDKLHDYYVENPSQDILSSRKAPVELDAPSAVTLDEWMKWAVGTYLPYRFWLEKIDKSDENADKFSEQYGEWVFSRYAQIVINEDRVMHKILPKVISEMKEKQHALFVILDNFNYKFVENLCSYMAENEFVVKEEFPVLAMIPTETAISKRAFFLGEAYNDNDSSYEKIVSDWAERTGLSMKYIPDVGNLRSLKSFDERIIFLNYLKIDKLLHEDLSASALSIEERICQELQALIRTIVQTLKRLGREQDTEIYFIADHGSTKILPEQVNEINVQYYKNTAEESDYRFIAVSDSDFETMKSAVGGLCFTLERTQFNTKKSYFIARKYNRFIRNDLNCYVHGGISPEESIVPFIHFAYNVEDCVAPEIIIQNDNLRFMLTIELALLVKNTNSYALTEFEIEILNPNCKWTRVPKTTITENGITLVKFPKTRITKSMAEKDKNERLFMRMTFKTNGIAREYSLDIPMNIKSSQGGGMNLLDF